MSEWSQHLEKYAELIVKVGVNVQQGQEVFVTGAIDNAELVRLVARRRILPVQAMCTWNGQTMSFPA